MFCSRCDPEASAERLRLRDIGPGGANTQALVGEPELELGAAMTVNTLIFIVSVATLFLAFWMSAAWLVQCQTGQSGWVDAMWTIGIGLAGVVACLHAMAENSDPSRAIIVALCVAIWSVRLASHIAARTRSGGEDPRYASLRMQWGENAPRRMFQFLQIQAIFGVPLVVAVTVAAWNTSRPLGLQDAAAALVFISAVVGEAIADAQLSAFIRDPKNNRKVCNRGLWNWSRHPNYFFEWLAWTSYPIFAINIGGTYHWGWLALVAPIVMYLLLTRLSGIPPLEKHMEKKYGDQYRSYQRTTSAFFPYPSLQKH